jgi:hypothetical protein
MVAVASPHRGVVGDDDASLVTAGKQPAAIDVLLRKPTLRVTIVSCLSVSFVAPNPRERPATTGRYEPVDSWTAREWSSRSSRT